MNRLQVLFCLVTVLATSLGQEDICKGPIYRVNGVKYVREILKDVKSAEYLSFDAATNTLYFGYQTEESAYNTVFAKIDLNSNEFESLSGFQYVSGTAVDAKTNNLFVQASGGFYKYDKNTKKPELHFAEDYNIASYSFMLFAKSDIVYFTTDTKWIVYKIENGVASKFEHLENTEVKKLVIDDHDNMYYSNDTGLYRQKIGSQDAVYYQDTELLAVDGLVINAVGDVYAYVGLSGIYAVSRNTDVVEKILDDTARGLAFDGGYNIIYSDYTNLYSLKPNNNPNCVWFSGRN